MYVWVVWCQKEARGDRNRVDFCVEWFVVWFTELFFVEWLAVGTASNMTQLFKSDRDIKLYPLINSLQYKLWHSLGKLNVYKIPHHRWDVAKVTITKSKISVSDRRLHQIADRQHTCRLCRQKYTLCLVISTRGRLSWPALWSTFRRTEK